MIFKHQLPNKPGYYWVVDIDYPDPTISFVQGDIFWIHGKLGRWLECKEHLAFGDKIEKPDARTNTIEKENV